MLESKHLNLKPGLSGLIRANNEAKFIGSCIDSVIDSLSELIVVYNDCTDDTEKKLLEKVRQYPDKLRIFPYNHKILSHNLTKEEFNYAINLPENSERLHSSQCNYALKQSRYKYAVKIDPDQIYFPEEIKEWCELCKNNEYKINVFDKTIGWTFSIWLSIYRRISQKIGNPATSLLPEKLSIAAFPFYKRYSKWLLLKGKASVSLSGFNIFYINDKYYITFDNKNIHPPYNGEGDHLIFKISEKTYFSRYYTLRQPFSVTEMVNNPCKMFYAGPAWYHLHANRDYCKSKVTNEFLIHPEQFLSFEQFSNISYSDSMKLMSDKIPTLFQKTLFAFVHAIGKDKVIKYKEILNLSPLHGNKIKET